jgi:hypothetical protein
MPIRCSLMMLPSGYRTGLQCSTLFMSSQDDGPRPGGEKPTDRSDLRAAAGILICAVAGIGLWLLLVGAVIGLLSGTRGAESGSAVAPAASGWLTGRLPDAGDLSNVTGHLVALPLDLSILPVVSFNVFHQN